MPLIIFLENSDDHSKISGSLQQYYKDESALNDGNAVDFDGENSTGPFIFRAKIKEVNKAACK